MNTAPTLTAPATSVSQERAQLLESFELSLAAANLSDATIRLYTHGVRKLDAFLGRIGLDAPLSSISADSSSMPGRE